MPTEFRQWQLQLRAVLLHVLIIWIWLEGYQQRTSLSKELRLCFAQIVGGT